ncbi:YciI family protein [Dyella nitratireducens]|uniref:YCII-related domain-containing protein n=1 Tax=Dyella nitratireducens TaxID=1849580 RepID=A0ABQ1G3N1_9GAMM|nr:YciI family protein [Dyella nitratireducens]GGA36760.1 hypothetical protein GCM10010981_27350 [Dyella nitratireducens]GLQ41113.1 hypothetical protein GCM10007902_09630 [Dyella nitratireducens]
MKRFLVMLMRKPQLDPAVIPLHQAFLAALREQGRNEMSGGFADKSGGAYLLRAESLEDALEIAHSDPAHTSGGWDVTVYEWNTH